ncbi:MAG: hypothetical protein P4L10_12365 [Acidobacteriaceae bacterium]|nr:hypothetical protein [Acidobacteriaceae bacterium]
MPNFRVSPGAQLVQYFLCPGITHVRQAGSQASHILVAKLKAVPMGQVQTPLTRVMLSSMQLVQAKGLCGIVQVAHRELHGRHSPLWDMAVPLEQVQTPPMAVMRGSVQVMQAEVSLGWKQVAHWALQGRYCLAVGSQA